MYRLGNFFKFKLIKHQVIPLRKSVKWLKLVCSFKGRWCFRVFPNLVIRWSIAWYGSSKQMLNMCFYMFCWFWFTCLVIVFWPTRVSNSFSNIILTTLTFTIVYFACWMQLFVFQTKQRTHFFVSQIIANRN